MRVFTLRFWSVGLMRRPWLVTVFTVSVCAGFAARAAGALVDASIPVADPAPPPPRRPPPAARVRADGGQLVDRNMFCSACRLDATADAAGDLALPQATLIATGLGPESSATLVVTPTAVQGAWGVGDAIPGLGRLARIAPTWVE